MGVWVIPRQIKTNKSEVTLINNINYEKYMQLKQLIKKTAYYQKRPYVDMHRKWDDFKKLKLNFKRKMYY